MNTNNTVLNADQLLQVLSLSENATAIYTSDDIVIEMANDAMIGFWGKDRSVIGKTLLEAVPELRSQPFIGLLKQVWRSGETYTAKDTPADLVVGGKLDRYYFDFEYRAIKDANGDMFCILHTSTDVTAKVLNEKALEAGLKREKILGDELEHANSQLAAANAELFKSNDNLTKLVESLAESENRFRKLVQDAPVAICVLSGMDMRIDVANNKILQLWGRTGEEVISKPLLVARPELIAHTYISVMKRVFDTGVPFSGTSIASKVLRKGQLADMYSDAIYQPLLDESGKVTGIMVVLTDVTDKTLIARREQELVKALAATNEELAAINEEMLATNEELRESQYLLRQANDDMRSSEEQLQFTINAADLGTWDLNPATNKFTGNERLKEWFGLKSIEDISLDVATNVIHEKDRPLVVEAIEEALNFRSGGRYDIEYRIVAPHYSAPRYYRAKGKALFDSEQQPVRFSGILQDINEKKQDEIRKNDFIGMVSHELKTPLTSLKAYVQMLLSKAKNTEDQFTVNALSKVEIQVIKMSTMINGFLNVSRLESGKIQLYKETFDLNDLIEDVAEQMQLIIPKHRITLSPSSPMNIFADKEKIGQVLTNFLSNAAKYSPAGQPIEITCNYVDGQAVVSVKDEGIGLKPQDKEKMFSRYYRVEEASTKHISGFGIGLYLSSEIIKSHKGNVWVESTFGVGSTFFFSLPIYNN